MTVNYEGIPKTGRDLFDMCVSSDDPLEQAVILSNLGKVVLPNQATSGRNLISYSINFGDDQFKLDFVR